MSAETILLVKDKPELALAIRRELEAGGVLAALPGGWEVARRDVL